MLKEPKRIIAEEPVNLEYVQEVVRDELLLKNGESLFVSRNYRHTIKSQHLNFIRNHF